MNTEEDTFNKLRRPSHSEVALMRVKAWSKFRAHTRITTYSSDWYLEWKIISDEIIRSTGWSVEEFFNLDAGRHI